MVRQQRHPSRLVRAFAGPFVVVGALCLAACGESYGLGVGCSSADQCESGLACMETFNWVSAGEGYDDCASKGTACTVECNSDADCEPYGGTCGGCGTSDGESHAYCERS